MRKAIAFSLGRWRASESSRLSRDRSYISIYINNNFCPSYRRMLPLVF
jgi:hypothetical protein